MNEKNRSYIGSMRQQIGLLFGDKIMAKWLFLSFLVVCFVAPVEQSNAQVVRDHREVPGAAAQWKVAAGQVDPLQFHALYNAERQRHLATSSGKLVWENTRPGSGLVFFENCTRPGEVVYSSDRVSIRFGDFYLIYAPGGKTLDWTNARSCEFRLIPSRKVFAPVGSNPEDFAIYNTSSNRYLVYRPFPWPTAHGLTWQNTASGKPPVDIAARADFIPVDLFFTVGMVNGRRTQVVYLTIQNIGNVRSSASQQVMKVTIRGEQTDFLVLQPVAPGAILRAVVRLSGLLQHCESVGVELDTNPDLKFQVGIGASTNDDVFANDRKTLFARDRRPANLSGQVRDCEPAARERAAP